MTEEEVYVKCLESFFIATVVTLGIEMTAKMMEAKTHEELAAFSMFCEKVVDRMKLAHDEDMSWADSIDESKVN